MPGVFISYRREDSSGYTGRLFDILSAEFGRKNIYMDLDTIEGGDNFASVINQRIGVSDVLIAVIGERWLTVKEENGTRRLENPRDFVRIEIAEALKAGIRVIPVLVAGAAMPPAPDLPEDLRPLCERQAVEIRDSHFHQDAQQLTQALHGILHARGFHSRRFKTLGLIAAILFAAVAVLGAGILLLHDRAPAPPAKSNPAPQESVPPRPQALPDIAGKWIATVKYDWGDTYSEKFEFQTDGQELSGTAGFLGIDRTIREGKITPNQIVFTLKTQTSLGATQYEDTHSYKGIVEGGTIRFTMVTDSRASEHTPVHFTAKRP